MPHDYVSFCSWLIMHITIRRLVKTWRCTLDIAMYGMVCKQIVSITRTLWHRLHTRRRPFIHVSGIILQCVRYDINCIAHNKWHGSYCTLYVLLLPTIYDINVYILGTSCSSIYNNYYLVLYLNTSTMLILSVTSHASKFINNSSTPTIVGRGLDWTE